MTFDITHDRQFSRIPRRNILGHASPLRAFRSRSTTIQAILESYLKRQNPLMVGNRSLNPKREWVEFRKEALRGFFTGNASEIKKKKTRLLDYGGQCLKCGKKLSNNALSHSFDNCLCNHCYRQLYSKAGENSPLFLGELPFRLPHKKWWREFK